MLKLGLLFLVFGNVWSEVFKCIAPRPIMARIGVQVHLMLKVRDDARPMFVLIFTKRLHNAGRSRAMLYRVDVESPHSACCVPSI